MSPTRAVKFSLKSKMLLFIGGIITLVMFTISLGILFQWRHLILEKQNQNARAITRAFSISILDVLVYAENGNFLSDDLLQTYLVDFQNKIPGVKYCMILNRENRVIAHSDFSRFNHVYNDSLSRKLDRTNVLISAVYRHADYGWIVETVMPLQIGGKRWGVLRIGFDAASTRREIRTLFFLLFGITFLVISVTLPVLYIFIDRLTKSLEKLVSVMDETDLESAMPLTLPVTDDEIGFLIHHFELMRKRILESKSQLVNAQKQIFQAEKLASIGRLASGVAHEVNNPLNGIKNCVYAIQRDPEDRQQMREYLELINEGLNHIEMIVQKLLGFARQQSKSVEAVNLNNSVQKVLQLLDYKFKQKQITVHLRLDENLPEIKADEQLMQEVVMNLLLNSCDAVTTGGEIEIESGKAENNHIFISITDNGSGIPEEERQKIFDPFYTTKDPGEGTGLGLSVSLGIVEAHGGSIRVESVPRQKTRFTVNLPIEAGL